MSYFLINPAGRIVEVETQTEFDHWCKVDGFRAASEEQEMSQRAKRKTQIEAMQRAASSDPLDSVYLSTVTQGGKDGYGIASSKLIGELKKLGINVQLYNNGQKVGLLFHNPYSILRMDNQFRLLYTMFESDKIPADWHDYLEAADLVMVPSKWCHEVFLKSGFDTKIIPLGYDATVFKFIKRENKREARKNFTFLHYNAFNIRKGFVEVLKAFEKAFDHTEPVRMIFKTTLNKPPIPLVPSQYPNIEVQTGSVEDHELAELCGRADAFVFPSRGEGFGITPLEAMATGLPTIVPNAHGITEYFNPDFMYEVAVEKKCPAIYSRYKNQDVGEMVVCDVDHLAQQMRYIYEHQDEALEKGEAASEYVQRWTFANSAKLLKDIIESYKERPFVDKPIRNILNLEEVK